LPALTRKGREGISWILGGTVVVALLYVARGILAPFFVSFLLAYLLDPVIGHLASRRVPRTASIVALMVAMLLIIGAAVVLLYPIVSEQGRHLIENMPLYVAALQKWLTPIVERLGIGNPKSLQEFLDQVFSRFGSLPLEVLSQSTRFGFQALTSLVGFTLFLVDLLIIPVATFYLLRDWDQIKEKVFRLIPVRQRSGARSLLRKIDAALGAFIRGQVLIAFLQAVSYSVGFTFVGVPMGVLLGIVTGIASLVPYLGLVVGLLPALILSYIHFGDFSHLLGVLLVFAAALFLENGVYAPRIMGEKIGLHPVVILIAIVIGGKLFGFLGILFAIPGAAVINVVLQEMLEHYRRSLYYSGGDSQ